MIANVSFSIKILLVTLIFLTLVSQQAGRCDPNEQTATRSLKGQVTTEESQAEPRSPEDQAVTELIAGLHKKSSGAWPDYGKGYSCSMNNEPRVSLLHMNPDPMLQPRENCATGPILDGLQEIYYSLLQKPDAPISLQPNYVFNTGAMPTPVARWEDVRGNKSFGRADIAIAISRSGKISARVIRSTYPPEFTTNLLNSIVALSATPGTPPQNWRPEMVTMVAMFRNCNWPPPQELL